MQMRRIMFALLMIVSLVTVTQHAASNSFTIEQIKSYPFPNELTASATGARIAWAFNERGARNVWVAEGPDFKARRLTNYENDDGQELTSLSISADGKYVVYVRGGDHGSNFDSSVGVNPAIGPTQMKVQIWSAPFGGGEPKLLGEGDEPLAGGQPRRPDLRVRDHRHGPDGGREGGPGRVPAYAVAIITRSLLRFALAHSATRESVIRFDTGSPPKAQRP